MTGLVEAYQRSDINEFERILKNNKCDGCLAPCYPPVYVSASYPLETPELGLLVWLPHQPHQDQDWRCFF
jgi:hypothetical protein